MLASLLSVASAAVLDVPGEYPTVEAAYEDAAAGDVIAVAQVQVVGLPDVIDIPLTIRGVGLGLSVLEHDGSRTSAITVEADVTFEDLTLDGAGGGRLIEALGGAIVTLSGVEIRDGAANDGALVWMLEESGLVATDSRFVGGRGEYGGAVDLESDSWFDAVDTTFEDNEVAGDLTEGGALRLNGNTTGICTRCTFLANRSVDHFGGAIALLDGGTSLELVDSTFEDNSAASLGGAIHLYEGNALTVTGGTFRTSTAWAGGAIACSGSDPCEVTVTGAAFESNSSVHQGGHVWAEAGALTMSDVSFADGDAGDDGGAVAVVTAGSALSVTDGRFERNHSGGDGGAVHVADAALELVRPWACDNDALGEGGAVFAGPGPAAAITNGTFFANEAVSGGAIRLVDRYGSVSHGTFVANRATVAGAAVSYLAPGLQLAVFASITSGNLGAPAIEATDGEILLRSSASWNEPEGAWAGLVTETDPVSLLADPFPGLDAGACPDLAVPVFEGELVDGAPDLDLDGSPGDLGATGGPDADPDLWSDLDLDGVVALWDCDDLDPARSPLLIEVPGNAVDEDCDGVVDLPPGGTTPGTTTDPTAPTRTGERPPTRAEPAAKAGCSCANGPGAGGWIFALSALLATRRKRGS